MNITFVQNQQLNAVSGVRAVILVPVPTLTEPEGSLCRRAPGCAWHFEKRLGGGWAGQRYFLLESSQTCLPDLDRLPLARQSAVLSEGRKKKRPLKTKTQRRYFVMLTKEERTNLWTRTCSSLWYLCLPAPHVPQNLTSFCLCCTTSSLGGP